MKVSDGVDVSEGTRSQEIGKVENILVTLKGRVCSDFDSRAWSISQ